jgi:hypothetical protein
MNVLNVFNQTVKSVCIRLDNSKTVNLSLFLNHGPPKISNDSLVLVGGLVDRRFSVSQNIWKGERMPEHHFPPPVFWGDSLLPPKAV